MNKSLFIAFLASVSSFLYGSDKGSTKNSEKYEGAVEVVRGVIDELGPRLKNGAKDFTQDIFGGILEGTAKNLEENGKFDKLIKEASGALGRGLPTMTKDISKGVEESAIIAAKEMDKSSKIALEGMGKAADNAGEQMSKTFAEGGKFDKGQQQLMDTNAKNINRLIYEVVHKNFIKMGVISLGISGGYLSLRYGVPFAFEMLKRKLTRPKLIIESSKKGVFGKIGSLFSNAQPAKPMVFAPALEKQLSGIVKVASTINNKIKQGNKNVKYRNLMLYGPPGTGKTMFAKELARRSGLEYAFMSGSSFSKFKDGEGIEALDELFAWAKRSKGLMIFIDEAETFLSKRENMDPQSKAYQLLNNFLNYTGERSDRFMVVFATNHKDALDSAMYRRIDDLIEMPLPAKAERINLLNLYKNKILMDEKQNGKPFVDSVRKFLSPRVIAEIAEKTKGLSGGDIEGIINTLKTDTDILEPALVTPALIDTVVERAVKKHHAFTGGKLLGSVED